MNQSESTIYTIHENAVSGLELYMIFYGIYCPEFFKSPQVETVRVI